MYFLKTEAKKSIKVSGGWEFIRPDALPRSIKQLQALAKAYGLMRYDVAFLGKQEALSLKSGGIHLNSSRLSFEQEPFTIIKTHSGDAIGFVRFPSLKSRQSLPSEYIMQQISQLVRKYQKDVKLIIGLTDWGWLGERDYLAQAPQFMPDILLGSGEGSGVNGRIEANGRCIWVRPYDKGRTVNEIEIYEWPKRNQSFSWESSNSMNAHFVNLDGDIHDDPKIASLFN